MRWFFKKFQYFFDNNLDEMKNLDSKVYMYNQKFNFHFLWRHYHPISVRILFPFISIFDYAFSFEREKIQKILWKLRKFNQFPKRGGDMVRSSSRKWQEFKTSFLFHIGSKVINILRWESDLAIIFPKFFNTSKGS